MKHNCSPCIEKKCMFSFPLFGERKSSSPWFEDLQICMDGLVAKRVQKMFKKKKHLFENMAWNSSGQKKKKKDEKQNNKSITHIKDSFKGNYISISISISISSSDSRILALLLEKKKISPESSIILQILPDSSWFFQIDQDP